MALRYSRSSDRWLALDSERPTPVALSQLDTTGALYALTEVATEADFMPLGYRTSHVLPCARSSLVLLGPFRHLASDVDAAGWLYQVRQQQLAAALAHATAVSLVSATCIEIAIPESAVAEVFPNSAAVTAMSASLRHLPVFSQCEWVSESRHRLVVC
jgi:hypothetical protein